MNKFMFNINDVLLASVLMSLVGFSNSAVFADGADVIDEIGIEIPVSCTMSGTGMQSHNAEISTGTYQADIGTTTLHAFCNDNDGFSIYAAGYTGDEVGGVNSNKLVGTLASGNAVIDTGLATSAGTPDVSNWAMKLAITQDSGNTTGASAFTIDNGFNSYHEVPNEYTKVAHKNVATDITAATGGVKLTTTYAAYMSKTQSPDTYSGQVVYTLVHPANRKAFEEVTEPGKICYYPNGNNVVGTMGCQTIPVSGTVDGVSPTEAFLLASNFSRVGYGFAGWSTTYDYSTTGENSHFYGPQETITFAEGQYSGSNNGLSLYAVWVKSQGSIQDKNKVAELCGSGANALIPAPIDGTANLSSVSALTDQRDNETYAIAKLADGNCWMIENLRLEAENTRTPEKQALSQGYGSSSTYGSFSGLADSESAGFADVYTANSLYYSEIQEGTASIDIGSTNLPAYRMPRYNNLNTPINYNKRPQNPTSNVFTDNNTTAGMYSYGNYYTWHAAIANISYYSGGSRNTTSICPTGWMIPLGNTSTGDIEQGESDSANRVHGFSYLDRKMGGTGEAQTTAIGSERWRKFPTNFLYSGYFTESSAESRGNIGRYWSSTAYGDYYSFRLYLSNSLIRPGTNGSNKYNGESVRCIAVIGT